MSTPVISPCLGGESSVLRPIQLDRFVIPTRTRYSLSLSPRSSSPSFYTFSSRSNLRNLSSIYNSTRAPACNSHYGVIYRECRYLPPPPLNLLLLLFFQLLFNLPPVERNCCVIKLKETRRQYFEAVDRPRAK